MSCYKHGVNAYVVKPVDFGEFMKAVKQLGIFWAAINEPPPHTGRNRRHRQQAKPFPPEMKGSNMKSPLHILHLEDDPNDVALAKSTLEAEGITCATICVETRADFVAALERGGVDLILSDFSLPAFDGLSALEIAHARCPDIPFIFISGNAGRGTGH